MQAADTPIQATLEWDGVADGVAGEDHLDRLGSAVDLPLADLPVVLVADLLVDLAVAPVAALLVDLPAVLVVDPLVDLAVAPVAALLAGLVVALVVLDLRAALGALVVVDRRADLLVALLGLDESMLGQHNQRSAPQLDNFDQTTVGHEPSRRVTCTIAATLLMPGWCIWFDRAAMRTHRPDRWQHYDPGLFDAMTEIVASQRREVRALEATNLLPGALFASEMVPIDTPASRRRQGRCEWFAKISNQLADANLVFVDPDNGLEPAGFTHGSMKAGKSIMFSELVELAQPGRCLIVYHHHTRRVGGHHSEIAYWAERLRASGYPRSMHCGPDPTLHVSMSC